MKKYFIAILATSFVLISLTGCKEKSTNTISDTVKTDAEYKAQAEKEITKDNMLDELDKIAGRQR